LFFLINSEILEAKTKKYRRRIILETPTWVFFINPKTKKLIKIKEGEEFGHSSVESNDEGLFRKPNWFFICSL
jgi:hypothetical protein